MPPLNGGFPEAATAIRTDFYLTKLPILLDPVGGWEKAFGMPAKGMERAAKGFDPIATARLLGPVYAAAMRDSAQPLGVRGQRRGRAAVGRRSRGGTRSRRGLTERADEGGGGEEFRIFSGI